MTPTPVRIGDRTIAEDADPFVIAEPSADHPGLGLPPKYTAPSWERPG